MDNENKLQSLIIVVIVLIGILLGQVNLIQSHTDYFIENVLSKIGNI